jgi:TRAP transporter 4TM/12TM fusion protein
MGAAAFIMIEFTGTAYSKIIVAAAIPAVLYFISVFFQVGFVAKNLGLSGLPKEQLPNPWVTLKKSGYLIFPVFVLLFFLFYLDSSPMRAGIFSLFATIIVSLFSKKNRLIKLDRLANALIAGIRNAVPVAIACACAGIVVGITTLTGIGLTLSSLIIKASGGSLMIALILTMIASIILGMGLPPSACYIILAVMVAPALIEMGVPLLAAHMFIFYFGSLAVITLPVALASYTAAALAGSKPFETGYRALWLGLAAFIVPYMFVYGPSLLTIGTPLRIFTSFLTAVIGVICLASALQGRTFIRIGVVLRIGMAAAALLLIRPGMTTDIFGVGLAAVILVIQKVKQRIDVVRSGKQSKANKGEEK